MFLSLLLLFLYLGKQQTAANDVQTVPSGRFTRPGTSVDPITPPPTSPTPFQQATTGTGAPLSPRSADPKVFSRPPLAHPKTPTGSSAIEALTRQISMSTMGSNDSSTNNGQNTVLVKDTKITPSSELIGAVTRAKDSTLNN